MPTTSIDGFVSVPTGTKGSKRQGSSQRREGNRTFKSERHPVETHYAMTRVTEDGTDQGAIQLPLSLATEAGCKSRANDASVSQSASFAFANSERIRARLEREHFESIGRSIELFRLANMTPTSSLLFAGRTCPTITMPPLQYQRILGISRPLIPCNALAIASLERIDPALALLSTLPNNQVGIRPTLPSEMLSFSGYLNTVLAQQQHQRRGFAHSTAALFNESVNPILEDDNSHPQGEVELSRHTQGIVLSCRPPKKKRRVDRKFSGLTLHTAEDREKLNDHQILLRKQIEIFRATQDDILSLTRGKNKPIFLNQVGLRCRHCCHHPAGGRKKGATYFPSTLMGIYQAAQNLCVEHLQSGRCTEISDEIRDRFSTFSSGKSMASGAGKKYWAESGKKLGLVDTEDGIRFASDLKSEGSNAIGDASSRRPEGKAPSGVF